MSQPSDSSPKKLWDKGTASNSLMERFTIGQDPHWDVYLAPFDILGSLAHIRMLEKIGLLSPEERVPLSQTLQNLYPQAQEGLLQLEPGVEDIHSQVELLLTRELGDVGKKIHAGRSRNDQVLLDLKLYFRHEIRQLTMEIRQLFDTLIGLGQKYQDLLMPGYTHTQVAMPSSFGLWFGAYAESLSDDLWHLQRAYEILNQNPLGSAAGYGSSFALDRLYTTELLGFPAANVNVVYAQMGRGKVELILSQSLAVLANTLNKLASDSITYLNQNYGFFTLAETWTTGSSIMPHKKNPDAFELIRARSSRLMALPQETQMLIHNLGSGYHRDFQLLKEHLFPAFAELRDCLEISRMMLSDLKVNPHLMEDPRYQYLFSVEVVNQLVQGGMPFREAYRKVAQDIEAGRYADPKTVNHSHLGSIGQPGWEIIQQKMDRVEQSYRFEIIDEAYQELLHDPQQD